jgi:formylglycine-generating enzyme
MSITKQFIQSMLTNMAGVIPMLVVSKRDTMKKLLFITMLAAAVSSLSSCGNYGRGQLVGVQGREEWYMDDPYGMLYIPMGSYNMGPSDQDVPYAVTAKSKTVSVQAFYMDETEITNNEYRQFVYWVRDSIAHLLIGEDHILEEGEYGERINWDEDTWRFLRKCIFQNMKDSTEEEKSIPES